MTTILHPLVHLDIIEAMEFYEREGGTKLAADFFHDYEKILCGSKSGHCHFRPGMLLSGVPCSTGSLFICFSASNQSTYLSSSSGMRAAILISALIVNITLIQEVLFLLSDLDRRIKFWRLFLKGPDLEQRWRAFGNET